MSQYLPWTTLTPSVSNSINSKMENPRQKSMTLLLSFDRSAGPFMPQVEENNLDPLLRRYLLLDTCKDVSNNKKNQAWKSENRQGWLTARSFWLFSFENLIEFFSLCCQFCVGCLLTIDLFYSYVTRPGALLSGPVYTYPDSFVSADVLLRLQNFTRPHASGFVAFSTVHMYPNPILECSNRLLSMRWWIN